jgi:3-methylfumaryl-CoA hydratase
MQEHGLEDWIGRTFVDEDTLSERLIASFKATMEPFLAPADVGIAPLGSHWCLFPTREPMEGLGADGHPRLYPYLPPPPLPRRMWAGGRLELLSPLRVDDRVRRTTTITGIQKKNGRSGELWFVNVDHEYATQRGVAIRERQDIVYRAPAGPDSEPKAPTKTPETVPDIPAVWRVSTPPTLLFRYSALIFVSHRIHYDLPYATEIEGYEGLVVHGPLQATLLLNAVAKSFGTMPGRFAYRGVAPSIGGHDLEVCVDTREGGRFHTRSDKGVHMTGNAEL